MHHRWRGRGRERKTARLLIREGYCDGDDGVVEKRKKKKKEEQPMDGFRRPLVLVSWG